MTSQKKKLLSGLIITSALLASAAKATPLTISSNTNSQIRFTNDDNEPPIDSLIINNGVSVNVAGSSAIYVDSRVGIDALLSIQNNGNILSNVAGIVTNDSNIGTITNDGIINISGGGNYGIILSNPGNGIINNSGSIFAANGIAFSSFANIDVNNTGTISTGLTGISIGSGSSTITNSGSGSIVGSRGIVINNADVTINNSASFSNSQENILVSGGGNIVINNSQTGSMNSIENSVVINGADSAIINNSGSMFGGFSVMTIDSENTVITNSGSMFTSSVGIVINSGNSQITNNGIIEGSTAISYNPEGNNILTLNSGSQTIGDVDFGSSDDNEVNINKGSTIVGDINFTSGTGNSVNLQNGTNVNGILNFGSGAGNEINIVDKLNSSTTYQYSSTNPNGITVNTQKGTLAVQNGNYIAVIDQTPFSVAQEVTLRSTIEVGNLVGDRLTQARLQDSRERNAETQLALNYTSDYSQNYNQDPNGGGNAQGRGNPNQSYNPNYGNAPAGYTQNPNYNAGNPNYNPNYNQTRAPQQSRYRGAVASDATYPSYRLNQDKTFVWSEVFGSYQERSAYESNGDLESKNAGVIIGADKKIAPNKRLGGFVGGLSGATDINIDGTTVSTQIDSKGIFAGTYLGIADQANNFVDFTLIAGLIKNDSERLVNEMGTQAMATASYNNIFITPAVTIGNKIEALGIIPSLTLRYTEQWVEGYSETGTTVSDIDVESRSLRNISGRLKIETANQGNKVGNGNFNINARVGIEANKVLGDSEVEITVLDQNVSFTPNSRDYNVDGFVGFNTSFDFGDSFRLYADIEGSTGLSQSLSNNDYSVYGKLGFKYGF